MYTKALKKIVLFQRMFAGHCGGSDSGSVHGHCY